MKKADATREKLLTQARRLMWARGYAAVSLREVAQAAGVDVALVSRYFGGKLGLFEATLEGAFPTPVLDGLDEAGLVELIVEIFVSTPRGGDEPSPMRMLELNAHDAEVGDLVRAAQAAQWQEPLSEMLGSPARAALLMAAILGFSMAEKSLHLDGIARVGSDGYTAQLRHVLSAALAYPG